MKKAALLFATLGVAVGALAAPPAAFAGGTGASSGTVASASPTLSSIALSATDVLGGTPVTGTATLTASAPSGGLVVALSSDNPAGSLSATFAVTTLTVPNPQSALIIGTAGGVTTYAIITVRTPSTFSTGSISVLPAGSGGGTVTSQPTGISCTYVSGTSTGVCTASFAAGTVVQLSAQAAGGSKFQGWRGTPGCSDPSRITVARGTNITCQPGFTLK